MFVPLFVNQIIRRAEKLYYDKLAVVDGEKRYNYKEYGQRVNRLSNALLDFGIKPQEKVAILCYNTHQLLEAYYGVPQIGAVLTTINIRFSPQEISYVLNDSQARVLLFHKDFLPTIKEISPQLSVEKFIVIEGEADQKFMDYESFISLGSTKTLTDPPIKETDIAELFYTSGTTGNPKGVTLSHRGLVIHALGFLAHYHYDDSDVQLHAIPLFHVNGWGTPQFLTWVGGTHVMMRKFEPETVLSTIQTYKVTRIFLVPTMINMLLKYPKFDKYNISSLKLIIIGGAPTIPEKVKEVEERFGCRAISAYGMTETSPVMLNSLPKAHKHKREEDRLTYQSKTGLEMIGVQIRVVDPDGNDIDQDGIQVGEIICRANSVLEGYLNLPEETGKSIVDGWFHTGDMAVIDNDYYITIVDRKKDVIISGGENIASVEVENTINSCPVVLESAVIGIPDERWGEIPKAYVVLKQNANLTDEELIKYCKEKIAGYKVPRKIEFVENLPKSGTGKILKRKLRDKYWVSKEKMVQG
ncbi:fatty-acyl-CoA synthase [Desulfotomaculum arcticum]|uniref:Fatty-acyl-CoA synthase n=1 Tax=Desulfotruncus arcticus DSM 17038 TaxID=1121424 RepID=A0A1I2TIK4_9FIRM|nr:long-chain-fatty-acid--CoA ligase [Desulfotruncus arcticus]SFG63939.1 fatty-acyl-CoA synthase [Desulfotomaculum arcticum] [Desulfotruncus arcticus DSM 17038]